MNVYMEDFDGKLGDATDAMEEKIIINIWMACSWDIQQRFPWSLKFKYQDIDSRLLSRLRWGDTQRTWPCRSQLDTCRCPGRCCLEYTLPLQCILGRLPWESRTHPPAPRSCHCICKHLALTKCTRRFPHMYPDPYKADPPWPLARKYPCSVCNCTDMQQSSVTHFSQPTLVTTISPTDPL